jgi:prepilin-type N-terminal cleavage/methylation domain-containing protein
VRSRGLGRLGGDDGFTLVELLVTMVIATVGIMAVVSVLEHSQRLNSQTEKNEVASHIAEREIESVSAVGFAQLGLTSLPSHSASPTDPDYYVTGSDYQWDQTGGSPAEPLSTGGTVVTSSTWSDTGMHLSGEIHRYITIIGGDPNVRRVTVAVTVTPTGDIALRKPVVLSTIEANPIPHG